MNYIAPCADIADALCATAEALPIERLVVLDRMATEAASDPTVLQFAAVPESAGDHDRAALLLDRIHRLVPYIEDPAGRDVFRPVLWTLANGGDCEDLSTLFVACCRANGMQARLVWLEQQSYAPLNHVSAQVIMRDGVWDWQWADASLPNALVGQHPYHVARESHTERVFGAVLPILV